MQTSSEPGELTASAAVDAVTRIADPQRAQQMSKYLQAGPGGYAEGDEFLGVSVPDLRAIARRFRGIARGEVAELLTSTTHEIRHLALIMMGDACARADAAEHRAWVADYLEALHAGRIDNWDLVDVAAGPVLGHWCLRIGDISLLTDTAAAQPLWVRRAGIVGGQAFLRHGDAVATLAVAPLVVGDRRDLIQKAFGWMLREMGKRVDPHLLSEYLDTHAAQMGRTALGYAIEHLDRPTRVHYRGLR
ncbi:DNA alkylation repair protein [Gordonia sp. NPDC003504]